MTKQIYRSYIFIILLLTTACFHAPIHEESNPSLIIKGNTFDEIVIHDYSDQFGPTEQVKIVSIRKGQENAFAGNEFFAANKFYNDTILRFGLDDLSRDTRIRIIKFLVGHVSENNIVMLVYKKRSQGTLNIAFSGRSDLGNPIILVFTNFNLKTKSITLNKAEFNVTDSHLYIRHMDGRLISQQDESKDISNMDSNLLADYYLYNDSPEDDSKIENLLKKHLEIEKDPFKTFIGYMTYGEYYLAKKEYLLARKKIDEGTNYAQKNNLDKIFGNKQEIEKMETLYQFLTSIRD